MEYKFNSLQTELTDNVLKDLDSSSISELYDCLSKIHLLQALSNPNRKYCKDLQRWDNPNVLDVRKPDKKGRIYVDLENPHILENMDYFRPAAKHFEEFGCYTKIFENPDPNSEYMKFWNEERRRCVEGYVRESDGEWISGYLYHYWNYGRVQIKIKTGKKTAIQKEGFPELHDSDYWFAHYVEQAEDNGEFGFLLKKRRWGYSYKLQNMICRNYIHIKQSKNFILASEKEYIYKDGPQPKFKANLSFIEDNTPFWSPRLKDTDEHTKSGYKDKKLGIEKGRLSELICVTCKDDPDKGRGKSGKLVAFEEIGVFPGLEKTWTVAEESVKQGELVYGFMLGGGTGGTDGADFSSAEKMFYSPEGYNIKSMRNIYSKTNGTGVCSMFVPAYVSFEGLGDENGNSDVIGALIKVITQRQKIRNATHDSQRLLQTKAEIPITPEEAVLRKEGSIFPVLDIKEYLSTIYPLEDKFCAPHYVGQLALNDDNSVKFCLNGNLIPVRHYPTKPDIDKTGALEIFEHPMPGNRDKYRYIIGTDPIENDEVLWSVSLASIFVFDRFTRRIVAEYTGRPSTNDYFEICYRLALYYNATIMYENNKKGLFGYFQLAKKALHMLADYPQHLADKQEMKPRAFTGNTAKGYTSTPEIKRYGRRLQADWLLETAYTDLADLEYDDEGNPINKNLALNIHKIRSIGYLEECSQWNPDGNFDRVDAMTAVLIYDAELGQYEQKVVKERVKTLADDPFFRRTEKMRSVNGLLKDVYHV